MKHRFEVLDIFRGIFSSMVVFFHMSAFSDTVILNNNLVQNGDLFVDFFFVLSGFVITYTHQRMAAGADLGLFYKKRLFRLYPLHLVMLMVFVGIESVKHFFVGHIQINHLNNPNNNLLTFFTNLFLVHSVKFPGVTDVSWNIPSWSISAEMLCYLLFGLLVWLIHKMNIYRARDVVYALVIAVALSIYYSATGDFNLKLTFDYGFLRAWIGFFSGAICFNLFLSTRERVITMPAQLFHMLELVFVVAMVVMVYSSDDLELYGYLYTILFFLSIYVFSFEKGFISASLKRVGLLQRIGTYSYSIYMTHALLLSLFNIVFIRLLKLPPSAYSYLFIVNYVLIYVVSRWTYKHIEMRFQWKKKK